MLWGWFPAEPNIIGTVGQVPRQNIALKETKFYENKEKLKYFKGYLPLLEKISVESRVFN